MRRILIFSLLLLISSASFAMTPSSSDTPATGYDSILGVWKANQGSLPMMTLTVEQQDGKLAGAVLFFLLRKEPNQPETAIPGAPEPLVGPTFDGKTLSFKVNHSHAHPGSDGDKPVAFRFDVSSDGKIRFNGPGGQEFEMVRETPH
jgi:hypothetical protein